MKFRVAINQFDYDLYQDQQFILNSQYFKKYYLFNYMKS